MHLKELIEWLEKQDPKATVKDGFGSPHSDRGHYQDLGFDPVEETTFGAMLSHAKAAIGATFTGYKGGEFTMHEYTDCHIGEYGTCGEEITSAHLKLWLLTANTRLAFSQTTTTEVRRAFATGDIIVVMSATTTVEDAIIIQIDQNGVMSNVIARLRATGRICEVTGHQWRDGRPGEGEGSPWGGWYADYHPGIYYRTCRLCGTCQSRSEGTWK